MICYGCVHCGCDRDDDLDCCYVCADCDDCFDGNPEEALDD